MQIIDKSFGFDTAVEEAQRAINAAHVEAESADNGIGVVKLMGRYSGMFSCLLDFLPLSTRLVSLRASIYIYIVSPNHLVLREPPIIDLELVQLSLASATSSCIFLKVLLIVDVLFVGPLSMGRLNCFVCHTCKSGCGKTSTKISFL
jgi:hypothetical protein